MAKTPTVKKISFICPSCRRSNATNNTNKKQKCSICGEGVELELKRNGNGKRAIIAVLSVKLRT